MKKVLSLVLVLTLVLGSFGMVFAAAPSDVVGHKAETSVNVLVNMGIINGYPDGTYKPEGIVTRAEMAKILVTALGLGKMASGVNSSFTDMAGHWADGVVAYAASLGMIVGYPDGSFKPDATVSYEEAATMMVRALGYDDRALIGTWPGNYVSKALALGLYKNVTAASGGANRGDIALMIYELLDEQMGKVTDDGKVFAPSGDTMLKINSAYLDADDDNVADAADTAKAGFEITASHNTSSKSLIKLDDFIGKRVYVYKNKDNKIIAVAKVKSDTLVGKIDKNGINGIKVTVDGKDYDIVTTGLIAPTAAPGPTAGTAGDAYVVINGDIQKYLTNAAVALATEMDIDDLHEMTVTINGKIDGTKITPYVINAWISGAGNTSIVTTGDVYDIEDVLDGSTSSLFGTALIKDNSGKVDFSKLAVVGTATKLEDIKKDDVVELYKRNDGKLVRIRVSNKIVEGKVTKNTSTLAAPDGKVTINGEEFKVSNVITGGLNGMDAKLIPGATAKVWVAGSGKIVKVNEVKPASAQDYAMVIQKYDGIVNTSTGASLKVLTKNNEMVTLKVNTDGILNGGAAGSLTTVAAPTISINTVAAGDVITYKTDSSGNIKEVKIEAAYSAIAAANFNSRTSKLKVGAGTYEDIASNVVVFKFVDPAVSGKVTDSKVIALADVSDATAGITGGATKVINTDGDVVAIAVIQTGVKATSKYAVVAAAYDVYSESDDATVRQLELITADGKVSYMFEKNLAGVGAKGDLVKIELTSGRLNTNTAVTKTKTVIDGSRALITEVNADNFEIKTDGAGAPAMPTSIEYYDETVFYVATFNANGVFDGWVLGSATDARVNAEVVAYDLNQDGEDYVDDAAADIYEVVFIVKSGDAAKTL